MRKLCLLVCILFSLQHIAEAQEPFTNTVNPDGAKIKFAVDVIDYGTIEKGANGKREFKFTNVGKELLIITNVNSSCGCLVPGWPKEPIKPGGSGVITAQYDTNRVGRFEKTLTVSSNDIERPSIVLKVKGIVLPSKTDSTSVGSPSPK